MRGEVGRSTKGKKAVLWSSKEERGDWRSKMAKGYPENEWRLIWNYLGLIIKHET